MRGVPVHPRQVVQTLAASRRDPQIFLGARWVSGLLRAMPGRHERRLALWLLSLSPHYFYPRDRSRAALLDEDARMRSSREQLVDVVLRGRFTGADRVLDYGCGPGYLAASLSTVGGEVVGVDISAGALACARAINGRPNVRFDLVRAGAIPLPDGSVDAICSFAVVQHVTDADFEQILGEFARVLAPGGRVICHVPVDKPEWESEAAWRGDQSLRGRLKLRYALNCFGRTQEQVSAAIVAAGFTAPEVRVAGELGDVGDPDIASQELFDFTAVPAVAR
jgi:SAM-dependent methyltransferase